MNSSTLSSDTISDGIKIERENAIMDSERRQKIFADIITGTLSEETNFLKLTLEGIACLVCVIIPTLGYTLIPVHNVISFPEYWYEYPLQVASCAIPYLVANGILRSSFYLNVGFLKNLSLFIKALLGMEIFFLVSFLAAHIVWSNIAGYHGPIPFTVHIFGLILTFGMFSIIWHRIPMEWRKNDSFKRRLWSLLISIILNQFLASLSGFAIGILYHAVPLVFNGLLPFFSPLFGNSEFGQQQYL